MMIWRLRQALAGCASLLIITAYIICIIIAKVNDTYTGGLSFPYFSDIGRDPPAYYVFAVFLSVAGVLMVGFMVIQNYYFREWFSQIPESSYKCRSITSTVCGSIAGIAAALLSIFDTSSYPSVHNYSAYVFFVFILVYTGVNLSLYRSLATTSVQHQTMLFPRYVVVAVLGVAFIIYIPVGLALVSFSELTMTDCLAQIDTQFCLDHSVPGTNNTDLWDYRAQEGVNLMRTSSQFISVISVMVFLFFNVFDPYPEMRVKEVPDAISRSNQFPSTAFSNP